MALIAAPVFGVPVIGGDAGEVRQYRMVCSNSTNILPPHHQDANIDKRDLDPRHHAGGKKKKGKGKGKARSLEARHHAGKKKNGAKKGKKAKKAN